MSVLKIPPDQISDVQINYEPPSIPSSGHGGSRPASAKHSAGAYNGEELGEDYVEMSKSGGGGALAFDEQPVDEYDNDEGYTCEWGVAGGCGL